MTGPTPDPSKEGSGAPSHAQKIAGLVHRIADGDSNAAAEFVQDYAPFIRGRIRAELDGSLRRIWDSEDIFATVSRRLITFVEHKRVRATNVSELLSLLRRIASNSILDKGRIMVRLRETESEDAAFAAELRSRVDPAPGMHRLDLDVCLAMVSNERDRFIVTGWMLGWPNSVIAAELGMSEENCHKRWQRVRDQLKRALEQGAKS